MVETVYEKVHKGRFGFYKVIIVCERILEGFGPSRSTYQLNIGFKEKMSMFRRWKKVGAVRLVNTIPEEPIGRAAYIYDYLKQIEDEEAKWNDYVNNHAVASLGDLMEEGEDRNLGILPKNESKLKIFL